MHSGQRGAAHVNIFFFLIMLVLFLGAVGFAYVTLQNNTKLEEQVKVALAARDQAIGQELINRHYAEDLAKVVASTTAEWPGRPGFNYSEVGVPDPLLDVTDPARVDEEMKAIARDVKVPEAASLSVLFSQIKSAFETKERSIRDLEGQRSTLQNEVAELKSSISDLTASHKSRESELNRELRQASDDYQASLSDKDSTIAQGSNDYRQLREEKSDLAAENARIVAGLRKEIETLQAQTDAALNKVKLINPAQAADGMVLDASQATGLAWINLGRNDMLPLGMTFEIYEPGTDEVKAYGTVSKVDEDRAELRVTGLKDKFDPVVTGDQVRNDLYSPDLRHNVYLMGRFSQPYTKPLVKAILTDLGNNVVDKLGPGVDLIILGADTINEEGSGFTPIDQTEDYQHAQFLRIEMAPLGKVRQYLKLTDDLAR